MPLNTSISDRFWLTGMNWRMPSGWTERKYKIYSSSRQVKGHSGSLLDMPSPISWSQDGPSRNDHLFDFHSGLPYASVFLFNILCSSGSVSINPHVRRCPVEMRASEIKHVSMGIWQTCTYDSLVKQCPDLNQSLQYMLLKLCNWTNFMFNLGTVFWCSPIPGYLFVCREIILIAITNLNCDLAWLFHRCHPFFAASYAHPITNEKPYA